MNQKAQSHTHSRKGTPNLRTLLPAVLALVSGVTAHAIIHPSAAPAGAGTQAGAGAGVPAAAGAGAQGQAQAAQATAAGASAGIQAGAGAAAGAEEIGSDDGDYLTELPSDDILIEWVLNSHEFCAAQNTLFPVYREQLNSGTYEKYNTPGIEDEPKVAAARLAVRNAARAILLGEINGDRATWLANGIAAEAIEQLEADCLASIGGDVDTVTDELLRIVFNQP